MATTTYPDLLTHVSQAGMLEGDRETIPAGLAVLHKEPGVDRGAAVSAGDTEGGDALFDQGLTAFALHHRASARSSRCGSRDW